MTSLVLPAYNPGPERLTRTLVALGRFLRARRDWEAVIVCDGCTDGTPGLARAARVPRLRVLSYARNRGKGYAVRRGLMRARGERRLFTDIDLAYGFADIVRVDAALRSGADVAIADREHPDSRVSLAPARLGPALGRRVRSHLFGALARRLLPFAHADTQAGLKGVTAAVAESLLPNLVCDGFGFDCELLAAAARYDFCVREVPVTVRLDGGATTTDLSSAARMAADLWRIRRRWPATGYPPRLAAAVGARLVPAPILAGAAA